MSTIEIKNLTKRFGHVTAVDGINLTINSGELVSLLGPSGCGKTTTLRAIAGLHPIDDGTISVGDRVLSSRGRNVPPEHRGMAMIFQTYAIWPHMTVAANIAYGLNLKRVPKQEVRERIREMLQVVRLEGYEDRYPSELSGGQQQRVALARALIVKPRVLLLDEPLSNLDATLREEMRFEIRRLHDEFGITTVYVTHDQGEAMVASDKIVVMDQGKIVQEGTAEEIYDRPETQFVARFIGQTNLIPVKWVGPDAVETPAGICRVVPRPDVTVPGQPAFLSIRPHRISISAASEARQEQSDGLNTFSGLVRRAVFLGDTMDYSVRVNDRLELRVMCSPDIRLSQGTPVQLSVKGSHCIVVR